jgi:hypothetical protein
LSGSLPCAIHIEDDVAPARAVRNAADQGSLESMLEEILEENGSERGDRILVDILKKAAQSGRGR